SAGTRNRRDRAAAYLPNPQITGIRNVERAARKSDLVGRAQLGTGGADAIPVEARRSRTGERSDHTGAIDLAHAVIGSIGNVDVAGAIQRNAVGIIQLRCRIGGLESVAGEAGCAVAR